jgi:2-polyprenyl-3-methyl-5-hydroxy-6-metoxy-1,4-benzoquinol methylase
MTETRYTGTDNLEVMKEAVNYNRSLIELIKRHARKGERILDFGAGVGTFAIQMARGGYAVECVEPDAEQRSVIAANGLQVYPSLAEVRDSSVDFAYTFNVLEHIEDDLASIRQIGGKLRVGGKLLIYVPAFPLLYTSMDRKVGHVRRYKQRDLRAKVAAAGLTVLTTEYVDSLGFLATLVYRLVGSDSGDIDRGALRTYDRFVFPVSRWTDRALKRVAGKNVLLVAEKNV